MAEDRPDGWVGALLAVRFLTELALLGGLAWLGVTIGGGVALSAVLAVVFVVVIAVFWGLWMAPRARLGRIPDPARLIVEIVLFGGTAIGLIVAGHVAQGIVGGVLAIAAAVLARQFAPEG